MSELTGLAADLDLTVVRSLLLARPASVLVDPAHQDLVRELTRGVSAEVAQIIGGLAGPPGGGLAPGTLRDLALWAVALGVAANIESALFPEGVLGDGGRAQLLQARYLGVRAQLVALVAAGTGIVGNAPGSGAAVSRAAGMVHLGYGG